ncbi:MAG: M20/M25/M40 family metallo-hydrolase [Gemmatimonadaceae bacterium]|nr:M20/M25/M40 family metallo-hydrolase [Gemmatimonadaceae bacterium]
MLLRNATCAITALVLSATALASQDAAAIRATPRIRAALDSIRAHNAWTIAQQISICQIPAPPFNESKRGLELRRRFQALGLTNVRIDSEGNVIGERTGTGDGPTVVISGHLDTVFPEGTKVTVRKTGTRLAGPGIGDDCRGLAVLLAVARAFNEVKLREPGSIYFVGTVGEEGAGNLRGVRHLFSKEMKGKIDYFISVDGIGLGITSRAVGSHRYRVSYRGPGGHSYGAFGMPNPIHALGRAIAAVSELRVPADPKTTFSVGILSGGTSVNSISSEATMEVDLRSESAEALETLDAQFQRAVQNAHAAEHARWPDSKVRLTVKLDTMGIRPAGGQMDTAHIVRVAQDAQRTLEIPVGRTEASSTDANIPMGLGIPAITIDGGGTGGGAHSLTEWYDDGANGFLGPQWAALIVAMLAGGRS